MAKARVLVVEDEKIVARDIQQSLEKLGYEVCAVAGSGEEAIRMAGETGAELVLMDIVLRGEVDGVKAAEEIRNRFDVPVVYLTAYADGRTLERAKVPEPFGYVLKPFEERELQTTIEIGLYKHKMEKKLRESEECFSTTLRSIGDAVIATDARGAVKFMNPVAEALTGWEQKEASGRELTEIFRIINEETRAQAENPVARALREGVVVGLANHSILIARDGKELPIADSAAPIRDDQGSVTGVVMVFRDITERREAERAVAAEKERLAVTLRSIGDGVIVTDTQGKLVLINKVAETLTGWPSEEAAGRPLNEVFHIINEKTRQRCDNPVEKVMQAGLAVGLANHTVLVARDGTERFIADSGASIHDKDSNILGVVLVFRDVTEKRKLEEELQKVEKLESVGILAGGIAHDFNNILTAILGNIVLAKMHAEPGQELFEELHEAEKASLRARHLTQQLLAFSRGAAPVKTMAPIADVIRDSATFALRGSNVRCEFHLPEELWPVEADVGQLHQVVNNLIMNADQAMPGGGTIRVSAENITGGAEYPVLLPQEGT